MARINIDARTASPGYASELARFRSFRASMKGDLKLYFKLSEEQKEKWRAKDPLLDQVISFCHNVEARNKDD